ncbi:hypothetical protein N7522_006380 [Penicillium canescens]|nr:hypothetical protein N7522_006380 [Penicillium canescens]
MSQSKDWISASEIIVIEVLLLQKQRTACLSDMRGCSFECSSVMYDALTKQMKLDGLLSPRPQAPFTGLSYQGLVHKVCSFSSPQWRDLSSGYPSY